MPRRPITLRSRHVLRGLILGFLLVLMLLGASGWVAVRRSQLISDNVAKLARNHFIIARLIHDVQMAENAMTEVLHRVAEPGAEPVAQEDLLLSVDEFGEPLSQHGGEARNMAGGPFWTELEGTFRAFADELRDVLVQRGPVPPEKLRNLFLLNSRTVSQVNALIRRSSDRLAEAEREIESQSEKLRRNSAYLLGASLVLAVACAATTVGFVRHSIERMNRQSTELDQVYWHMLQGQEHAARRFSHELHDELGQSLAAVRSNLTIHGTRDLDALRSDCLHLVDQSIANVRELSQLLRPVILDDFGLEAGLQWLTDSFGQRTRLAVDFRSRGIGRYSDDTETHLFRIAQEALTNVARHSGASAVRVELHSDGTRIRMTVEDNGRGLRRPGGDGPPQSTLGLVGMRARAKQCGGDFTVSAVKPSGLRIEAVVPVSSPTSETLG